MHSSRRRIKALSVPDAIIYPLAVSIEMPGTVQNSVQSSLATAAATARPPEAARLGVGMTAR